MKKIKWLNGYIVKRLPIRGARRNPPLRRKESGFTLIELVLYFGIFSILLLVLVQIFGAILDAQQESQATSAVSQDSQFILARLTYDINRAENIVIPEDLGGQSNSLQIIIDGINYTYSLNNGNLLLTNDIGADTLNGFDSSVSNLSFTRLGNLGGKNTISLTFKLTSKTRKNSGFEVKNFQTTLGLR